MTDRIDIDALLIGALYGELTPADEARLSAHLESHPADRTALSDLTRTRAAVRASRIFETQFEPPASVSALLMQEVARRLPRKSTEPAETSSWFQRFVRAFMAHPAMAAAAMLVLVIGVASTVYVRKGDQFAHSPVEVTTAANTAPALESVAAPSAPPPSVATPSAEPTTPPQPSPPQPSPPERIAPARKASPRAATRSEDRSEDRSDTELRQAITDEVRVWDAPTNAMPPPPAQAAEEVAAGGTASDERPDKPTAPNQGRGIELRKQDPSPKDVSGDDDQLAREAAKQRPKDSKQEAVAKGGYAGPRAQAPAPSAAQAPSTAQPPLDSQSKRIVAASEAEKDKAVLEAPQGRQAVGDLAWSRQQHSQVVALVKSSNCREAAATAIEIYNRDPAYYTANVANDRSVKPCLPYLNNEQQRTDVARAKRMAPVEAGAPAQQPQKQQTAKPAPAKTKSSGKAAKDVKASSAKRAKQADDVLVVPTN